MQYFMPTEGVAMGAWGVLAFDNDDANDWANGLSKVSDLSLVESAFTAVDEAGDYLEAPTACEALAACELLARLRGRPGYENAYTKKVDDWVKQHSLKPSVALLDRADSIIDRILADKSELRELWEEGDASEWLQTVEELRGCVRG
jgi:hypothetical protein